MVGEDKTAGQYLIKLFETDTTIRIPDIFLNPYWKKLIYTKEIFPFYFNSVFNVLLSSKGKDELREFLEERILEDVSNEDEEKVRTLIEEFVQPQEPKLVESGKYYVIYRRIRTFASFVLTPKDIRTFSDHMKHGIVIYDACSYITLQDQQRAYYYSAVLNYLAFKVIQKGGAFERNQYLRPLIAVLNAGLEWKNKKWQVKVARLGKRLHQQTPKCLRNFIKGGIRIAECFERIKTCDKTKNLFTNLIQTIDKNANMKRVYKSLRFVCKLKNPSHQT